MSVIKVMRKDVISFIDRPMNVLMLASVTLLLRVLFDTLIDSAQGSYTRSFCFVVLVLSVWGAGNMFRVWCIDAHKRSKSNG